MNIFCVAQTPFFYTIAYCPNNIFVRTYSDFVIIT
jgi:hypothetical protein